MGCTFYKIELNQHNIKSRFINESRFEKAFSNELKNTNFSFFFDCIPSSEELYKNPINIYAHEEPNEYFGHHDWVIKNKDLFMTCYFNIGIDAEIGASK